MVERYRQNLLASPRRCGGRLAHQQLVDAAAAIARQRTEGNARGDTISLFGYSNDQGCYIAKPMFWQARLLTLIAFALRITNSAKGSSAHRWLHYLTTL